MAQRNLKDTPWCLLTTETLPTELKKQRSFTFQCKESEGLKYSKGKSYSIYEIAPLERLLLKRNKSFDDKVLEEIYENKEDKTLCYILEWEKLSRTVLLIQNENSTQKIKEFVQQLENELIHLKSKSENRDRDNEKDEVEVVE